MRNWNGNFISLTKQEPTVYKGNGIFDLNSQGVYKKENLWPRQFDLVTNGLQLHLDAGDTNSYSGSGNEWYDLSSNGYHMALYGSPTFTTSGGDSYFDLDGTDDYGSCDGTITGSTAATVANLGVGGTNPKTVVCVGMVDDGVGSSTGAFFDLGDAANGEQFGISINGFNRVKGQLFGSSNDFTVNYDGRAIWTMYSLVYDTSKDPAIYGNNGTLLGSKGSAINLATQGSRPFEMGQWAGGQAMFGGKIALFLVYNRGLSVAEIQANYQALNGRFGF